MQSLPRPAHGRAGEYANFSAHSSLKAASWLEIFSSVLAAKNATRPPLAIQSGPPVLCCRLAFEQGDPAVNFFVAMLPAKV